MPRVRKNRNWSHKKKSETKNNVSNETQMTAAKPKNSNLGHKRLMPTPAARSTAKPVAKVRRIRQPKPKKLTKMDFTDSTTEDASEVDTVENDIKFDIHSMQDQCISNKQQKESATTLASTVVTLQEINAAQTPLSAPLLQNSSIFVCNVIKDECAQLEGDSSVDVNKEMGQIYYVNDEVMPPGSFDVLNNKQSTNCYIVADEMDLQETDSDEDGYSEINFDEEFKIIKCDADADLYNPDWLEITPIPYGAEIFYSNESDPGLRKEISKPSTANGFFYKLLGGSRFFQRLAESCNKEVMKPMTDMPINEAIEEFNAKEMSIFIGICLQMGSMQLTTLSEYWECKAYYHVDGFANKLCYQRFKTILEHLNFEDFQPDNLKTADSYEDKFMKLRPALYFFNKRMEFLYNCGKDLVLNDPIIYWKGRMNWLKDMKEKFRRNAVLIHLLSEPSGFVHKIYMDKESDERKLMAKNSKELVIERLSIATELLKEKLHRGHTVFVPKYYGSYALALELSKFDTYCSGFLELTRFGNSKQLVLHQLRQYKYEVRYANCIMMGKYNGLHNKNLYFYTSIPDYVYKNEFGIQNCLNMLKELAIKKKIPTELGTHMLSYQLALEHTEIKWDKRLMIYIIELMLQNAYILYNSDAKNGGSTNPNLISYQIFRQHIIASLLNPKFNWSNCNNEKDLVKTIATDQSISLAEKMLEENLQLLEMHKPKKLPPAEGKCMKKRCRMCNKTGFVAFSEVCCIICPGMPGLCQTPCFEIWHDRIQKRIMAGNYK